MNDRGDRAAFVPRVLTGGAAAMLLMASGGAGAWMSADQTLEVHGFVDTTTHSRFNRQGGIAKQRFRGQLEFTKDFGSRGIFSELSVTGTLRATYDAAYEMNDDQWGETAGGPVTLENQGGIALGLPGRTPYGASIVTDVNGAAPGSGLPGLPGGGNFGFNTALNPNAGLRLLGSAQYNSTGGLPGFGGVQLAFPVRPCDTDPRGCIDGYLDFDEDELKYPELFRDTQDWLRELYIDAIIPLANGDEIDIRFGRQQVVWGRTDLFRVLDQINPIDFSIQNIYEEFEDSRIPMGILNLEYRMGATGPFDDLNFQFVWNWEKFRPHNLGQGGTPYSILQAGDLFRALSMCWHFGCSVANFAPNSPPLPAPTGNLSTDFPAHVLGIRSARLPGWKLEDGQFGFRMEGVFKSVGFSLNALYFWSQLPSLHGGTTGPAALNPFLAPGAVGPTGEVGGTLLPRPYLIAFDIHFPRILLLGGSADFYVDPLKTAFRVEFAHTNGEEFPDTSNPRLYSNSRVIRWVVGADRPTFIKPLNRNRAFLISAQLFGQHLLDHNLFKTTGGEFGMPDWKDNFIGTLLVQGFYKQDRVQPRVIMAYDVRGQAGVVAPAVDWLITDNWRFTAGLNVKVGRGKNEFDDCRTCNPFPPFTAPFPGAAPGQTALRLNGIDPLGRFRSGPIGMAQAEDEFQVLLRYRF